MGNSDKKFEKINLDSIDVNSIDNLDSSALESALNSVLRDNDVTSMAHKDHNSHSNT